MAYLLSLSKSDSAKTISRSRSLIVIRMKNLIRTKLSSSLGFIPKNTSLEKVMTDEPPFFLGGMYCRGKSPIISEDQMEHLTEGNLTPPAGTSGATHHDALSPSRSGEDTGLKGV
ncbi:MAG TPA: hypothetical protein DGU45_06625 [Planctomycetes bacterium]|nr:hypothetical protein [Planctomycetota bacterium]